MQMRRKRYTKQKDIGRLRNYSNYINHVCLTVTYASRQSYKWSKDTTRSRAKQERNNKTKEEQKRRGKFSNTMVLLRLEIAHEPKEGKKLYKNRENSIGAVSQNVDFSQSTPVERFWEFFVVILFSATKEQN